jgi:hypothetical protein
MRTTLLTLALAATTLAAQDVKLGVQAQANLPMGDLKTLVDSKLGVGAGVHAQFAIGGGLAVRPRLDFNTWSETDVNGLSTTVRNKVSNISLGGDVLFHVEGKTTEGIYFLGGLALVKWSYEETTAGVKRNYDASHLGLSVGMGYQWNASFGTEARYVRSTLGNGYNGDSLSVGATLKF